MIKYWKKLPQQCEYANRWQIYHKELILSWFFNQILHTFVFSKTCFIICLQTCLILEAESKPEKFNLNSQWILCLLWFYEFCLRAQKRCSNMWMYQQWWMLKELIASKTIMISIFREAFVAAEGVTSEMIQSQRRCQFLTLARNPRIMPQTSILMISGENSSHFGRLQWTSYWARLRKMSQPGRLNRDVVSVRNNSAVAVCVLQYKDTDLK